MTQDKTERHVISSSAILLVLFVGLSLFVVSIVRADPGPDSAAGSATFRTKCAMCHGQDGGGSEVGKSMNVSDLRSPSSEAARCGTRSSHFQRQRWSAFLQEFAQRGSNSLPGGKNSLAASEEIGPSLYPLSCRYKRARFFRSEPLEWDLRHESQG
jgi:cytochrome c2